MPEMRPTDARLREMATRLRLTFLRDHLSEMLDTATQAKMTPRESMDYLFRKEIEQRDSNRIRLAQMSAHFPFIATFDTFDASFQPSIDPGILRELKSLEWINAGENVLLIGPSGVGKTHISIALGQLAIEHGYSVRFYSCVKLIQLLEKAYLSSQIDQAIREINKNRLLIIDELGFLPMTPRQGQLFFMLAASRYEKKSTIITSNKSPSEWGMIMGDAAAAAAMLDRLVHHCTPLHIAGDSYRAREFKRKAILKSSPGNKEEKKMESCHLSHNG